MSTSSLTTDEDFSQYYDTLQSLAGESIVNDAWIEKSRQTTSTILGRIPTANIESSLTLFTSFASLISLCPKDHILLQNFAHLTFLHLTHQKLYIQLKQVLAKPVRAQNEEPFFAVPDWWPEFSSTSESDAFSSPFEFGSNLDFFVRTHSHEICPIIHLVSCILSQLEELTTQPQPSWNCFAALIAVMSKSSSHRDLACLILCQEKKATEVLNRLCGLSTSTSVQRYAKFLSELLVIRPSILSSFSITLGFPGASNLMQLYPQNQQSAFEVAAKTPFRFIVDLLNHASSSTCFKNFTVSTCISISAHKLQWLVDNRTIPEIYESFNQVSDVNSLLALSTQFGCISARLLLENYGDDMCTSKFLRSSNVFTRSALPPLAKPNYFFAEQKTLPANETLAMLMKLDEFDELHRSLLRILQFLKLVLIQEVSQSIDMVPNEVLAEKIYVRKIQPIYSFILLVLKCDEKLDPTSLTSEFTSEVIFNLADTLLSNSSSSLAWTTLFNCATEASYNDITTSHLWFKLLKTLCSRYQDDCHKELICDGFRRYSATFHPDSNQGGLFDSPYMTGSNETAGVIAKSEYMFLYQNLVRNKCDSDESAHSKMANHYAIGGRQQSVHVDKFGKDRS